MQNKLARTFPIPESLPVGGIVGMAEITDCVKDSNSPWFEGPFGFVIKNPRPLPFYPMPGKTGFFDVSDNIVESLLSDNNKGGDLFD